MDVSTVDKIIDLGGQAGLLWLAIIFLTRTLKESYEKRIEALEAASEKCEEDRINLRDQIHDILIRSQKKDE